MISCSASATVAQLTLPSAWPSSVPAGADAALHADKDQLLVTLVELLHQQVHTLPEGGGEGGGVSRERSGGGGGTEQGDTKETTTIEEAVACSTVACKR